MCKQLIYWGWNRERSCLFIWDLSSGKCAWSCVPVQPLGIVYSQPSKCLSIHTAEGVELQTVLKCQKFYLCDWEAAIWTHTVKQDPALSFSSDETTIMWTFIFMYVLLSSGSLPARSSIHKPMNLCISCYCLHGWGGFSIGQSRLAYSDLPTWPTLN